MLQWQWHSSWIACDIKGDMEVEMLPSRHHGCLCFVCVVVRAAFWWRRREKRTGMAGESDRRSKEVSGGAPAGMRKVLHDEHERWDDAAAWTDMHLPAPSHLPLSIVLLITTVAPQPKGFSSCSSSSSAAPAQAPHVTHDDGTIDARDKMSFQPPPLLPIQIIN
jgi:hypothetical protein